MKEIYSKPQAEIVIVESEGVIADSIKVRTDEGSEITGPARSKNFWDSE